MDDDALSPAEEARDKRRDHRARAHERDLMRTGSAKVFKQILDTQEKRAHEGGADEAGDEADDDSPPDARRRHGHGHGHGDGRRDRHEDGRDH